MHRREFIQKSLMTLSLTAAAPLVVRAAAPTPAHPSFDLGFISKKLPLVPRCDWTNVEPCYWRLRAAKRYTRLTVHHSGARVERDIAREDIVSVLDGVMTSHRARHYGDVGYHFILDYAGRVWEGRCLAYEGAHVARENRENVAVMLLGNFEVQQPCIRQLSALRTITELLQSRFDIARESIFGHRDLGASACPGRWLYPYVCELRKGPPAPTPAEKT
jgi:hypothetical protein